MRNLIIILFVFLFFNSCNSLRKSVSTSNLDQEATVQNSITLTEDNRLSRITGRVSESFMNEFLFVDIVQKKYDTEKEINKETKKYPVIEETRITIKKNKDKAETNSIHQEINRLSVIELNENSDVNTKIKVEKKEEKEFTLKEYRKILLIVSGALFVFIIIRIRRKRTLF